MLRPDPVHGEIWLADLGQRRGAEMQKLRPVLVMNGDIIRAEPVRLVAPITGWERERPRGFWLMPLEPSPTNGLTKPGVLDAMQTRSADLSRFRRKLGTVTADELHEARMTFMRVIRKP